MKSSQILTSLKDYFAKLGFKPFAFQTQSWKSYLSKNDFIINVPTGMGKTLASMGAALIDIHHHEKKAGVKILYISPLRSLTNDIERNLMDFCENLSLDITIATRTGDTKSSERAKLKKNSPDVLLTTPESLNLMLTDRDYVKQFSALKLVVIDEWHVLYAQKRGVLLQLNIAWLDELYSAFQITIMSATMSDPLHAAKVLAPYRQFELVNETVEKLIQTKILMPKEVATFPWRGHLGSTQLENLTAVLDQKKSTLIFTNTRSQAEKWYQFLLERYEPLADIIGIHHSSIETAERNRVEKGLVTGDIKWVVCTSSLDLGIDFPHVEKVIQIGSAKSISRLIQRAGRAGHKPGGVSKILFVPTHAFEIFEYYALELALKNKDVDDETVPLNCYDVMAQFLVSYSLLDGLDPEIALKIINKSYSFKDVDEGKFNRILKFIESGGESLSRYPQYHRVKQYKDKYYVIDKKIKLQHLLNMGTITSHPSVRVKFKNGKFLGSLEDIYVAKLKKGNVFQFAGRKLQYKLLKDTTLYVELANKKVTNVPKWAGGILPLSTLLCAYLREIFDLISKENLLPHEKLSPLIRAQNALSTFPKKDELLIEKCYTKEGTHLFIFPFEGRAVHEGMGMLIASRILATNKTTLTISVNEYGIELLGPDSWDPGLEDIKSFLNHDHIYRDLLKAHEHDRLAQRKFNEIAQISGLVPKNFPGNRRTAKNLQVSSSLLYNVFNRFEPDNIFLKQAEEEVTIEYLNYHRLVTCLNAINDKKWVLRHTLHPTPFSFPLIIERVSASVSGEELKDRVARILKKYERDSKNSPHSISP